MAFQFNLNKQKGKNTALITASFRYLNLMLLIFLLACCGNAFGQKQKVWLDADTGNETDDLYAIVRLLNDTTIDLIGLSSAHFNNADLVAFEKWNQYDTKAINTVQISQQLNEAILKLSSKTNISHPLGADRQMGRAWGGNQPRNSAAAQQIIAAVKLLKNNEKLDVLCLGALTNIASAIELDTSIAKHIKCYLLGAKLVNEKFIDKNEFNIRNDLNAFDYLLNSTINLTIMPITTAFPFRFERDSLYASFNGNQPVLQYLKQRWMETNAADTVRTLWDVALVEAYLQPSLCTRKTISTPPENTPRMIDVYTQIELANMKNDYWYSIRKLQNK